MPDVTAEEQKKAVEAYKKKLKKQRDFRKSVAKAGGLFPFLMELSEKVTGLEKNSTTKAPKKPEEKAVKPENPQKPQNS